MNMKTLSILLSLLLFTLFLACTNPQHQSAAVFAEGQTDSLLLLFYNVENLFDTIDDPFTQDNEFTPKGLRRWNGYRYKKKLNNTYKALASIGGWQLPDVIGLCEIENRRVLNHLIYKTPLYRSQYQVIHRDSPDTRGIDVALLYRQGRFNPFHSEWLQIFYRPGGSPASREILYVAGTSPSNDTLHLFVTHWPSRYRGVMKTNPKRMAAAKRIRAKVDSILHHQPHSNILIMGDLNDNPTDISLTKGLRSQAPEKGQQATLLNLMANYKSTNGIHGTQKHRGHWNYFDQIIVSRSLFQKDNALQVKSQRAFIHQPEFLLEKDQKYFGYLPYRTYIGPRYRGGFSDHLPVYCFITYYP